MNHERRGEGKRRNFLIEDRTDRTISRKCRKYVKLAGAAPVPALAMVGPGPVPNALCLPQKKEQSRFALEQRMVLLRSRTRGECRYRTDQFD